jgi:chromosome segregation ATPase
MAERQSPSSISASPDDASGYRRGASGGRRRGGGSEGPRLLGINLILAVLVVGLVLAGWFIANQHQLLVDEQRTLTEAQARIAVLEDRLRVTDQAMTETGEDTQEKIGFWETEIRKLWAVTNDRNRKWIKDNEVAIAKQQKALDEMLSKDRELASAVGRHESAFKQQQTIVDQLTGLELQIRQVVNSQRDLIDKVNAAQQTVAALQGGLGSRVNDNEQAVASIDKWRAQLNTRLTAMERRLDNLAVSPAL